MQIPQIAYPLYKYEEDLPMTRTWWEQQEVCPPGSPRAGGRAVAAACGVLAEGLCSWQTGSEGSCACHIPSPMVREILPRKLPVSGEILRGVVGSFFFPLGVVRVLEGRKNLRSRLEVRLKS